MLIAPAALVAAGCSSPTAAARRAEESRPVTLVGCLQTGSRPDELVLVGRAVGETVTTATGTVGAGGLISTTTMRGGDPDRLWSNRTREDWASTLAPRLVGGDRERLKAELGHRVLVTGRFVPASKDETTDQVRVRSIEPVGETCDAP